MRSWNHSCLIVVAAFGHMCSGCAIYDPYRVWRFGVDYNTERAISAQWKVYDHLPPKTVRVRQMTWGYNVGPSPQNVSLVIPSDSPIKPVHPAPSGVLPSYDPDALERAAPPAILPVQPPLPEPPIPAFPARQEVEPYGPTARRTNAGAVQPAGATNRSVAGGASTKDSTTSWLFTR